MKIVALLIFKNEENYLASYISSITNIAETLVALDDESTDNSVEIVKKYAKNKIKVILQKAPKKTMDEPVGKLRQSCLEIGRETGGTHFICLDADEAFTSQFKKNANNYLTKMKPGDKLFLQWLTMWNSSNSYIDDKSVWSNNYKDFIFFDDGKVDFQNIAIHEPRTPYKEGVGNSIRIPIKDGAVFHWQFVPQRYFQIKQAYYRCYELVQGKDYREINGTFKITHNRPFIKMKKVPSEWYEDLLLPTFSKINSSNNFYDRIIKYFDEYGCEKFQKLEIWHIKELRDEYKKRVGYDPRTTRYYLSSVKRIIKDTIKSV